MVPMNCRPPTYAAVALAAVLFVATSGRGVRADAAATPAPYLIQLVPGTTVGTVVFPDGDTPKGARGEAVDNVVCDQTGESFHFHSHLSIFVYGRQLAVPAGIGIIDPVREPGVPNFVHSGRCFYDVHTHDGTGIIHIGAAAPKIISLETFFRIWGEPLGPDRIAGYSGPVLTIIDGVRQPSGFDPSTILLSADQEITIEIGFDVDPPRYSFPAGY
jgi:hypothetical protein